MKTLDMNADLYDQVEGMVGPIIESNAKRFHKQLAMTLDEARQEARFGLMMSLRKYDYNASRGGVYVYASVSVRRHFLKLWAAHRTQQRHPHTVVFRNGKARSVPSGFYNPPIDTEGDFMDAIPSPLGSPEAPLMLHEGKDTAKRLRAVLEGKLSPRDRAVLACKVDPPRGLQMLMCEELAPEPTIQLIGRYLGLSKNSVDWAIRRIRITTLALISSEFSELANLTVVQDQPERD